MKGGALVVIGFVVVQSCKQLPDNSPTVSRCQAPAQNSGPIDTRYMLGTEPSAVLQAPSA